LKTALFSIFGVTLKRAKMKASSRVNSRETSSGVRKRHFLAIGEISVRLKNVQMVFDSFATFFILLGGLVILTHSSSIFPLLQKKTGVKVRKKNKPESSITRSTNLIRIRY